MSPIKLLSAALCAALLAMPGLAGAAVYKCVDKSGNAIYQGMACEPGKAGAELAVKDAAGMGELSTDDQHWLDEAKPFYETNCPRMSQMGREAVGAQGAAPDAERVCRCATRKYFASAPISRLRALDEAKDTARIAQITAPLMAECRRIAGKPEPAATAGEQP